MTSNEPIPTTQYTRSGDIYLAYQVVGAGAHTLLVVSGFVSHLEVIWEDPDLARFIKQLAVLGRVILFDKRGVGLSERIGAMPTAAETMEDILVVLNAVGCEKATIMGVSEGGPVAIMFAATYPSRTTNLILYGTMPKWVRSYDYPWALSRSQYDQWLALMIDNWGAPVSMESFAPSQADDADVQTWWSKMLRLGATPGSLKEILEALRDMDVRPVLPHINVPTLVLHRIGDKAVPLAGGRFLAQNLPHCHFVELTGQDHWWWVGNTAVILQEIEMFLASTAEAPAVPSPLLEFLTEREMDVLRLIAAGYTNQQIADQLMLTLGTIKTYTSHIYAKLNVDNRTQALITARKQGLIR